MDKVGFGQAQDFETAAAQNPTAEKSIGRIWDESSQTYNDNDNNYMDFKLQDPTPRQKNISPGTQPPPEPEPEPEDTTPKTVVINEIAWMGTKAQAQDEWIELLNTTDQPIDIARWRLLSSDGGPDITFVTRDYTLISAAGFYLIERTYNTTTSETEQWRGSFGNGLGNENCEVLSLYDAAGTLIDQTACNGEDWPAGDNTASSTRRTMERVNPAIRGPDPGNWANNNLFTRNGKDAGNNRINGTPGYPNSVSLSETVIDQRHFADLYTEGFNELILTKLGSPWIIKPLLGAGGYPAEPTIPQNKILRVASGVTVKFNSDTGRRGRDPLGSLMIDGTLIASGAEANPILFTASSENGLWCGLKFNSTSADSELSFVIMQKAGCERRPDERWAMRVSGAKIAISDIELIGHGIAYRNISGIFMDNPPEGTIIENSILSDFEDPDSGPQNVTALSINGGAPAIRNNVFKNNRYGVIVASGFPLFDGNTFDGNRVPARVSPNSSAVFTNSAVFNSQSRNGIEIVCCGSNSSVVGKAVWSSDIPYIIEGGVTVNPDAKLTISAGMIVKLLGKIDVRGILEAVGTPEEQVIFTALSDDERGGDTDANGDSSSPQPGNFTLAFNAPNLASRLDNVVVRYGGSSGSWISGIPPKGAVFVERGEVSITNSVVELNFRAGVEIKAPESKVVINGVKIRQHEKVGLAAEAIRGLALTDSEFTDNNTHLWWPGSGGLCELAMAENSFDDSGDILCEGDFP